MTDNQLFELICKQNDKTATLTKLKYNKALVDIYFPDSEQVKYRFKFTSLHSARNFLSIIRLKKYKEIDKSKI